MSDENTVQTKAPGKAFRKGMTLVELIRKFPDNKAAEAWITEIRWPDGPECPRCGCDNVQHPTSHKTMPYRCRGNGCRRFFSVRVGTVMQDSKLGYQEWAIAVYLFNTSLKSVSSVKLHRDLGVSQKSAWHLAHRIRQCWDDMSAEPFAGPVEADESHFGGKAKNMHAKVRCERITGRGAVDKTTVVGVRDRATGKVTAAVVDNTDAATLQGFVNDHAGVEAMVYTDEHESYRGLPNHATVRHSVAEYVNGQAHVNGVESFWAALKRGYHGTFHHVSLEHLDRYVSEFAGRHNRCPMVTEDMMAESVRGMVGRRLTYEELIAS
ncbi:MAG: IS1595 family transposase [Acidimicrobiaceae bacterium]|nr:IS1595 family transposase [Acidimicrobiia bacterium]MCY4494704.1 IS1595 family transposase [Acidimicrobiaceae bacterium]